MFKFIKHAFEELEHVVWPTEAESKKYMLYTVGVIIIMATLLSILGYAIRGTLVSVRGQFDHAPISSSVETTTDLATEADLEKLKQEFEKKQATQSGEQLPIIEPTGSGLTTETIPVANP